jgi:hypothetical protein
MRAMQEETRGPGGARRAIESQEGQECKDLQLYIINGPTCMDQARSRGHARS